MRRFFSLRSSSSSSGNSSTDAKLSKHEKVRDYSHSLKDKVYKERKHYHENEDSSNNQLRRSHSFSYPAIYCGQAEGNINSVNDRSISPSSYGNSPHDVAECPINCHSWTPDSYTRTKRSERASIQEAHAVDKLDSPNSARGYQSSSGHSPCTSPIALRCRAGCSMGIPSKSEVLDLYIDAEHKEMKSKKSRAKHFSANGSDGCLAEVRMHSHIGKPPRARSTAPSSPNYGKMNFRSYSFREVEDIQSQLSKWDLERDEHRTMSPQNYTKGNANRQSHAVPGLSLMKSQHYDSETTTTVEDIYEASLDPQTNVNTMSRRCSSDLTAYVENMNGSGSCAEEMLSLWRQSSLPGNELIEMTNAKLINSGLLGEDTDEELLKKAKQAEERLVVLSQEEVELDELQHTRSNLSVFIQKTKDFLKDRRYLALELSSLIKCQIVERSAAREHFRKVKLELDARTRRLEKEKNELQLCLEKELDRRSKAWSLKLEKFQSEEQRLRERVRELAEQNVLLQREISSLKGNEADTRNKFMDAQIEVNALTASLGEVRTENNSLREALADIQERFNGASDDLDCVRRSYKEKEKENKHLQKLVVRLQRTCTEQDKTINGLRQSYHDENGKLLVDKGDKVSVLQMEQQRLGGIEQMLRREVESCRHQLELLRRENVCLLDRLQGSASGNLFSSVKLDHELRTRVDCLQSQGLSILTDTADFCEELLSFIKRNDPEPAQEANSECNGYSVVEHTIKHHKLRRGNENFRRALQKVSEILEEKSKLAAAESKSQSTESCGSWLLKHQDDLELELKAESIVTKVLQEKLLSRELEFEQLESDFASSVRRHDVLQSEIQRLQDELSCLDHKNKDMELQMLKTDERSKQLQCDLQECIKEVTSTKGINFRLSKERDNLWEEVKKSRETIMLLELEVISLKKKIEALDEDVLIKEGQITILKDSLGDKSFDLLWNPESVKEFSSNN